MSHHKYPWLTVGHKRYPAGKTHGPKIVAKVVMGWPPDATVADVDAAIDAAAREAHAAIRSDDGHAVPLEGERP